MITTLTKKFPGSGAVHRKDGPGSGKKALGGASSSWVGGLTGSHVATDFTAAKLIHAVQVGLPVRELDTLQASLNVPMETLVPKLGNSRAPLHRRRVGGRLGPAESDRVVRFARLMGRAVEVLESVENARRWLTSPQVGLGGAVPLDYAETEIGAREVEDLLGRVEYGVYS